MPLFAFRSLVAGLRPELARFRSDARFQDLAHRIDYNVDHSFLRDLRKGGGMVTINDLLQELEQETQTTRRVLERVPDNQLTWRPHEKARTLGELAMHIAVVPGAVAELIASPSPAQAPQFSDPVLKSASELLPTLEQSIANAKKMTTVPGVTHRSHPP